MSGADTTEIEVFRLGRHTDKDGVVVEFGEAEAEAMIAAYDPASDPAPIVVGHPKLDDPAYGWAKGFRRDGDIIKAVPDQLEPAFAEMVREGRFKRVSMQFYLPTSSHNPKPGVFYPKHIGFLGAAAPALKGLKPVSFAGPDGPGETVLIESALPDKPTQETRMSEIDTAAFAEQQEQFKKDREAFAAERAKFIHDGNVSFAEGLVAAGKLAPGGRDEVVFLLDQLADAPETASFGEGDGARAPLAVFRDLLTKAQPLVSFGEAAPSDKKGDKSASTASFAAPQGFTVDAAGLELHNRALELQRANPKLSYSEAAIQAARQ